MNKRRYAPIMWFGKEVGETKRLDNPMRWITNYRVGLCRLVKLIVNRRTNQ